MLASQSCLLRAHSVHHCLRHLSPSSLSCNVILRGTRSAGYGFVNVATDEAATKAVEALHGQDFQGRKAIIERAKPAEEKEKERSERNKTKRRNGRRGSKAVPGEVTEAEANGEAEKPAATADAEGENKPKKKKKKNTAVCDTCACFFNLAINFLTRHQ